MRKITTIKLKTMDSQKLVEKQDSLTSAPARLQASSPPFFKRLAKIFIGIGSIGGIIVALPALGVAFPAILVTAAGYAIAIGAVGSVVSGLPVDFSKLNLPK